MKKRSMGWIIAIALLLLLAAGGMGWWRYGAYHLATVQEGVLYRDGVRSERQFENAARKVNPKTVIRLIDPAEQQKEPFVSEAAYCRQHGIAIVSLPVKLGGWPTADQVRDFLAVVSDKTKQPVLVHCAQGVRRTGMMVAAYQRSILNWDVAKAKAAIETFGHSQRTIKDVQKFIDVYDPTTGAVPDGLPTGNE